MKTILIIAATAALLIGPATAASADELPPLPAATWDNAQAAELDCDAATWWIPTDHYQAEFVGYDDAGMPVYGDWVLVGTTQDFGGYATGDAVDADCANWATDDTGAWYDSNLTTAPNTPAPDPVVETVAESDGIVWKLGIDG